MTPEICKNMLSAPHSPEWAALFLLITDRYLRFHLRRFFSFCSARGIAPDGMNGDLLVAFWEVAAAAGVDRPRQVMRDAGISWNKLVATQAGWPQITLVVPDSEQRKRRSKKVSDFPASFGCDLEAFLNRKSGNSLFEARGGAALSPVTSIGWRRKILQIATRAVACGRDPNTITKLADLVAPETAKAILESLWREAGEQKNANFANLARLMVTIAKYWAHLPEDQLALLKRAEKRFRPPKMGMTQKNRERLRQFTDEKNVRRLVGLPMKAFGSLNLAHPRKSDAVTAQKALAVALLLVAPVRVKNLASIDIEQHIHRVSETVCFLTFPNTEVKNKQDLEYPLPAPVLRLLDIYVEVYRPLLAKKGGSKLFVSQKGNQKNPEHLSAQIPKFIHKELGLAMNAHLFRHFAGFIYLKNHPGEYETVRQLLGHKSIKTTIEFYTGLEQAESFRRYDDILDRYRDEAGHVGA